MDEFTRFAVYHAPRPGPLADFGAAWLGWDAASGTEIEPRELPGLPRPAREITETPRKYGFHGTLKPPFRLAPGKTADALHRATAALAKRLAPVTLDGLALNRIGPFLALTPRGRATALALLASHVVMELDEFRAAPTAEETARRRSADLNETQQALLARWGYPYVMEEFRFHLTLTGSLPRDEAETTLHALEPALTPILPEPFRIDDLCLFGEAPDGRFHLLDRVPLSG